MSLLVVLLLPLVLMRFNIFKGEEACGRWRTNAESMSPKGSTLYAIFHEYLMGKKNKKVVQEVVSESEDEGDDELMMISLINTLHT